MTTWNKAKGEAQRTGASFMKFAKGSNQFRLIDDNLVARYQYWVENAKGDKRPYECLQFDRSQERFNNNAPDPIREAGLTEIAKVDGVDKEVPLRAKRAYVALGINRASGAVEAIDLKKSIFDGIVEVAQQLGKPPSEFDIFVRKTGDKWYEIEYSVEQIKCMQDSNADNSARDAEDAALIKEYGKTVQEVFPRPSYDELKQNLTNFLTGEDQPSNAGASESGAASPSAAAKEAMSELDD